MPKKVKRKAEFWWASVAGAEPEPVEVIEENGRRGILTIGCPDPFWLDDATVVVRLNSAPMTRLPGVYTTEEEAAAARAAYLRGSGHGSPKSHAWRGPR